MFPIKQDTINIMKDYIDFNYNITFIGIPATQIFCNEIIANWNFFLEGLVGLEKIESENKIDIFFKEMKEYILLQDEKISENLNILILYNGKIRTDLKKFWKLESHIELSYYKNYSNFQQTCVGNKINAMKKIRKLQLDFDITAVLIPHHENWDKITYWAKNTRKALNKYRKDFSLSKEAINLNGQLYLSYISPYNKIQPYGSVKKFKDIYIMSLANQNNSVLKATIAHEYTHIFDQLSSQKYYNEKNSEAVFEKINSFLSIELLNQVQKSVTDSGNAFIEQYKKNLVSIISDCPYDNYSDFYKQNMVHFKDKLKTQFIEVILGEQIDEFLWEKNKKIVFSHPDLNAQIDKIIYAGDLKKEITSWIQQVYADINNPEGILTFVNKTLELKDNKFSYLMKNSELMVEIIFNNFYLFDNYLYKNTAFGTSEYMKEILNYNFKKHTNINYWTSIKEVIARHVQAIYPEKKHEFTKANVFNPVLTNKEKLKYKALIENMAVYAEVIPKNTNENNNLRKKIQLK